MSVKSTIVRHSLSEVEALRERGQDPTRRRRPGGRVAGRGVLEIRTRCGCPAEDLRTSATRQRCGRVVQSARQGHLTRHERRFFARTSIRKSVIWSHPCPAVEIRGPDFLARNHCAQRGLPHLSSLALGKSQPHPPSFAENYRSIGA